MNEWTEAYGFVNDLMVERAAFQQALTRLHSVEAEAICYGRIQTLTAMIDATTAGLEALEGGETA